VDGAHGLPTQAHHWPSVAFEVRGWLGCGAAPERTGEARPGRCDLSQWLRRPVCDRL